MAKPGGRTIGSTAIITLALAAPLAAVAADPARHEFVQTHMGSPFRIVLYSDNAGAARLASDAAFARIARLDATLSDYNPESELMRLCGRAGGPPVEVSADLFDALDRSLTMARRSAGGFDPTVAPVVRLWRRARRERKLPDPETLASARARVGYERLRLDRAARTVELTAEGIKLDLGGIGKGYASQAALDELAALGFRSALVAGSGDVVLGDPPPGRAGWRVAADPLADDRLVADTTGPVLLLRNVAVSTSGDARQFVEIDGVRYAHIVDPRTGLGVVDRSGVTVVAPDGATADSLATAAFVLGPDHGLALVETFDGAAALVVRETPAGLETRRSRRFDALPRPEPRRDPAGAP